VDLIRFHSQSVRLGRWLRLLLPDSRKIGFPRSRQGLSPVGGVRRLLRVGHVVAGAQRDTDSHGSSHHFPEYFRSHSFVKHGAAAPPTSQPRPLLGVEAPTAGIDTQNVTVALVHDPRGLV